MYSPSEKADLIIIGGGIYGICAANTYLRLHPSANIKVLDSDSAVGGVWSRSRYYPGFWSQTGIRLSGFPDKPFQVPEEAETYHDLYDAKNIIDYFEDYLRSNIYDGRPLADRFVFCCWVRDIRKAANGLWQVKSDIRGRGEVTFQCNKLIVATGAHSVPHLPRFNGSEQFKGPIVHSKSLGESKILSSAEENVESHKNITILGGSKSASDIAYTAATDLKHPRTVSWIIRTSGEGPLLMNKPDGAWKYRSVAEIGSTRAITNLSSANPFRLETWWSWILHKTFIGERLLEWIWSQTEIESNIVANFDEREGALDGFEDLRPSTKTRWRSGPLGLLQRNDYWDVIAQRVKVYRGTVNKLNADSVVLEDGRKIRSDVLICGTGWRQEHPYFSPHEALKLGLPIRLDQTELVAEERNYWSRLEGEADGRVLQRWPYLAKTPRLPGHPPSTTPYKLYNLTVPIEDQSIAFLGLMFVPNSYHVALVQTLYAIAVLDGARNLPSRRDMETEVAFMNRWCARRYPVHGWLGNVVEFEMVSYTDHLLEQLGLNSHRSGSSWWSDLTDPCLASDYAGLVDEYRRRFVDNVE